MSTLQNVNVSVLPVERFEEVLEPARLHMVEEDNRVARGLFE